LVAIADPSSTAGQAGLVDQSQFAKARDAIRAACDGLLSENPKQQQVVIFNLFCYLSFNKGRNLFKLLHFQRYNLNKPQQLFNSSCSTFWIFSILSLEISLKKPNFNCC